jgi:hypothetical protein
MGRIGHDFLVFTTHLADSMVLWHYYVQSACMLNFMELHDSKVICVLYVALCQAVKRKCKM